MANQYYLHVSNNQIDSLLPTGVNYENHVLTFNSKEPIDLEITYILNQPFTIQYIFKKHTQVNLIETKVLTEDAMLEKDVLLEENAHVRQFINNNTSDTNKHNYKETYTLKEDADIQTGYAELSDESLNGDYYYDLTGENSSAYVRMAILSKETEQKKYKVHIEHHSPNTTGQMDNYGVVKDQGHLTIDGIGTIKKGNHHSESHQTNKIMVFDPGCVASANPYLFIDEYDVKASHAAGVGKMDEEHLYYLQSRGLTKKRAMQLITYGYLLPVIEVVDNPMIKEQFESVLTKVGD